MKQVLESHILAVDAETLVYVIQGLVKEAGDPAFTVHHNLGGVKLVEETLTDGSKVHNLVFVIRD